MNLLKPCSKANICPSLFWCNHLNFQKRATIHMVKVTKVHKVAVIKASNSGGEERKTEEKRSFLSLEEAGMVEMSGLVSHEKFLCRLTISSLNLLRVIAEQEGCRIEDLNAGRVCDWFLKDKLKREQNLDSAVLQWDESNFQL